MGAKLPIMRQFHVLGMLQPHSLAAWTLAYAPFWTLAAGSQWRAFDRGADISVNWSFRIARKLAKNCTKMWNCVSIKFTQSRKT
jgi:hypothetical protein